MKKVETFGTENWETVVKGKVMGKNQREEKKKEKYGKGQSDKETWVSYC